MNEPEDYTDDESGVLSHAEIRDRHGVSSADLDAQFIAPDYEWHGQHFWPYRHGTRLFYHQVTRPGDTLYNVHAFLFIHLKRFVPSRSAPASMMHVSGSGEIAMERMLNEEETFEKIVLPLVADKDKFRLAVWKWMNSLGAETEKDIDAAVKLFNQMFADAEAGAVEVRGGSTKKKAAARAVTGAPKRSHVKRRSSSTRAAAST